MTTFVDRSARHVLRAVGIRSHHVATSVARHHLYDTGGSGTAVICLPGLSDSGAPWAPILLALRRRGHRVLVVEAAGHGLSPQARVPYTIETHFASLTEVLDQVIGGGRAVLVGNSLGGATALHFATTRPASVAALFLVSPAGGLLDAPSLVEIRRAFMMQSSGDARDFLARVLHRTTVLHHLTSRLVLVYNRSGAVRDLVDSLRADHVLDGIGAIDVPIRLVWGRSERLLPRSSLEWLRQHLPWHAIVTEPAGFGHTPHLDAPLRLARMIDEFVSHVMARRA